MNTARNPYRITPILSKHWLYDGYDQFLATQIRRGRRRPELFDFNSLVLDYGARIAANGDLSGLAKTAPSRGETAEAKQYRYNAELARDLAEALAKSAAISKQKQQARAEQDRIDREYKGRAEALAEARRAWDREWEKEAQRQRDVQRQIASRP